MTTTTTTTTTTTSLLPHPAFDILDTTRGRPGPAIAGAGQCKIVKDACKALSVFAKAQRRIVAEPLAAGLFTRSVRVSAKQLGERLRKAGLLAARAAAELISPLAAERRRRRRDRRGNNNNGNVVVLGSKKNAAPIVTSSEDDDEIQSDGDDSTTDIDELGAYADAMAGAHADLLVHFDHEVRAQADIRVRLEAIASAAAGLAARARTRDVLLESIAQSLALGEQAIS